MAKAQVSSVAKKFPGKVKASSPAYVPNVAKNTASLKAKIAGKR